jgi:hypothetical protein
MLKAALSSLCILTPADGRFSHPVTAWGARICTAWLKLWLKLLGNLLLSWGLIRKQIIFGFWRGEVSEWGLAIAPSCGFGSCRQLCRGPLRILLAEDAAWVFVLVRHEAGSRGSLSCLSHSRVGRLLGCVVLLGRGEEALPDLAAPLVLRVRENASPAN